MRTFGILLVVWAVAAGPTDVRVQPAAEPRLDLEAALQRIAASARGTLGVSVAHLGSGAGAAVNAEAWFPMMSVYKIPIAIHALREAERGALNLDARVTLSTEDRRPGLSPLARKIEHEGAQTLSVRDLVSAITRVSDNTASDKLLRLIGGPAAVSATLRQLRLGGIDVSRYELEFAADYYGVCCVHRASPFVLERFAAAVERMPAASRRRAAAAYLNDRRDSAQPRGMALLLSRLVRGELLGASSTAWLLSEMAEMHTRDTRLRAGLPSGTPAALRPGTSGETAGIRAAHNDSGVITLPDGSQLVMVAFLKGSTGTDSERDDTLAAVARAAYAWASGGQ